MNHRLLSLTAFAVAASLLAGCAAAPGNALDTSHLRETAPANADQTYDVHLITPEIVQQLTAAQTTPQKVPESRFPDPAQYIYRIGPQDILGITVWDHPELTTPQGTSFSAGGTTTQTIAGALAQPYTTALPGQADPYGQTVGHDGTIFFPFVGRVRVAGQTPQQVRDRLAAQLAPYIHNPQLDVRVLAYRSQRVQVTGDVKSPGPLAITDVPLTLVDAITRSGGTTDNADLQRVRLTRNGQFYQLDANGVLDRGELKQNVLLQDGDIINVPDRSDSRIFVMGEVKTPMAVPMIRGNLSIADSLTTAGGILDTDANPRQIYVIRGMRTKPTSPEIYRLDMTKPDAILLSTQFPLQPYDVVYVGTSAAVQFNRLMQQVLPTLQTLFFTKQLTK
ncbi:polysaccharide biosynthesis/export family protein [Trinickia caryophylli]|uniref:Polysaccharide export outer membrane protein n=1 Tax=Trinickia caryophylli TaxID=28094 RepID=A0A1X7FNU3_TRICW|nr:polysaccharide biosynthesis/export family protein [Trinickia caryophylli]PMS13900.1 exopolysaccharide biosynthesis protein [Trinickia caryophylli]TRX14398.1 exopolysaccharide biosynthesis protein [Trinickia caryophylli]WQE14235.1 polysaccharide biosynthesis/export family protein [Trinickia caryophylli]SMF55908.1 polysaccharide export outer membrane protein [Trinickia caryophylli]GLU33255.1 exopolysaccharide biosynthesis protein BceE [Trinickia caryophylli]